MGHLSTGQTVSDVQRYKYDPSNPAKMPFKTGANGGYDINQGDACYVDSSGNAVSANGYSTGLATSLATCQADFVANFVGVAAQRYDATNDPNATRYGTSDGQIRVDTGGVFEFDVYSGDTVLTVGQLVALAGNGTGAGGATGATGLQSQTVTAFSASATAVVAAGAIGRVAEAFPVSWGSSNPAYPNNNVAGGANRVKVRITATQQLV